MAYKRKPLNQMAPVQRERERKRRAAEVKRKADAKKGHSAAWLKAHGRGQRRRAKNQTKALLEGKARSLREKAINKKVQVHLKTFHFVNGVRYGPGTAWVPQGVLLAVLETERRALEAEDALFSERSHMIVASGRGSSARAVQVANPSFDQLWQGPQSPVFDQISGKGVVDVGTGPRF